MSRCILVYGQPASGKSFAIRTLDPETTVVIDADNKGALPWRGYRKSYNADRGNFFKADSLDKVFRSIKNIGSTEASEKWKKFRVLVIDGFNRAMSSEELNYDDVHKTNNKFEKYAEIAKKVTRIISDAQGLRDDLTVIFTAHVETADPYVANDVDKLFTPGKMLKDKIKLESMFIYVFYAKAVDGEFFFETTPNKSTARSPYECFEPKIPNDYAAIIKTIEEYEEG